MKPSKTVIRKWVAALRSGKYDQSSSYLQSVKHDRK